MDWQKQSLQSDRGCNIAADSFMDKIIGKDSLEDRTTKTGNLLGHLTHVQAALEKARECLNPIVHPGGNINDDASPEEQLEGASAIADSWLEGLNELPPEHLALVMTMCDHGCRDMRRRVMMRMHDLSEESDVMKSLDESE